MNANNFFTSAYGVRIPWIIYGTAWKRDSTAALVEQAISLGFRGIDTACQPKHYNEAGVGEGVAAGQKFGIDRSELYLQSKFTPLTGQDPAQVPYDAKAGLSEQVAQSFQTSLKNLQTTYLDCLVLHSTLASQAQTMEVWRAMEQIFDNGAAKQLGISNCYDPQQLEFLYRNAKVKPAVIQNRFYADTKYDRTIRDFCQQQQIIYQSFWTLTANSKVLAHDTFQALAAKYQRSVAQLFFRYLNQINIIPLTGTTSQTHMREDLAILDFELTTDECEAIKTLL
ncbi:aldo/keto reductase family protein [Methylobacter psychrophilus]|uniref:aldo/keto reductase family protein n=1 Tax=Methylobacter psychrophilus TaxID=96941 RepID=UPI0021D5133E|nr:aldo/keto reductase [Methylobacter psychrophilus]